MVDLNALITSWFGILFNYVASLASYEIVDGVNFFGILIAIGVFSIIVKQFFSRVSGGN